MTRWLVRRWIREYASIEAATKGEAIAKFDEDPSKYLQGIDRSRRITAERERPSLARSAEGA